MEGRDLSWVGFGIFTTHKADPTSFLARGSRDGRNSKSILRLSCHVTGKPPNVREGGRACDESSITMRRGRHQGLMTRRTHHHERLAVSWWLTRGCETFQEGKGVQRGGQGCPTSRKYPRKRSLPAQGRAGRSCREKPARYKPGRTFVTRAWAATAEGLRPMFPTTRARQETAAMDSAPWESPGRMLTSVRPGLVIACTTSHAAVQ